MKDQKGITLVILVVYIIIATIAISTTAIITSHFFTNVNIIKEPDMYAVEFNKFNMFFINDVKSNKSATVSAKKVVFADGNTYQLRGTDIYRNETKIASNVQGLNFAESNYNVPNTNFTKKLIEVTLSIGKKTVTGNDKQDAIDKSIKNRFNKTIEYVLKYW